MSPQNKVTWCQLPKVHRARYLRSALNYFYQERTLRTSDARAASSALPQLFLFFAKLGGFFIHRCNQLFTDTAFHLLLHRHQRFTPFGFFGGSQFIDRRLA